MSNSACLLTAYDSGDGSPSGTALYPAFSGTVVNESSHAAYGNYVILESTSKNVYNSTTKARSVYMHLSERASTTNSNLVAGATVYTSTLVGKVGSTGDSTAAHLHMSMIIDGSEKMELVNTTDPQMLYKNVAFTY